MYVYTATGRNYEHVSSYLSQVHAHMFAKFSRMSNNADKQIGKEVEHFFQTLKSYTAKPEAIIDDQMYKNLIDRLIEIEAERKGSHNISTFFRRLGSGVESGAQFEKDLGDVIQAMTEMAIKSKLTQKQAEEIVVGAVKGSPGTVVDQAVYQVLKELERVSEKQLRSKNPPPYALVNVYGKTDVQGLKINITGKADTYFEKMARILNHATFSLKSYRSIAYKGESKKMLDELYPNLHLGNSNPYRAVSGALGGIGADGRTIISAFCASWGAYKNGNTEVGQHIYHLRYIYELTGMGIINEDGSPAGLTRFFVYNDPAGDYIYVASTAEIVVQALLDDSEIDNPFGRDIVISKSSMRSHRYH